MKIYYFLFAFSVFTGALNAQNYSCFSKDRNYLFSVPSNTSTPYKGLKTDSIKSSNKDTILFFNKEIKVPSNVSDCYSINGNSSFGQKLIKNKNGINCFINYQNDSIYINTLSQVNDSWILYKKNDTTIEATTLSKTFQTFMGQNDSVKTISLQYKINNTNQSHTLNQIEFKLSKKYGLIQTTNFNFFPGINPYVANNSSGGIFNDGYSNYYHNHLQIHNLVGISNPNLGVQNIRKTDIYDFNVGDEFHYTESFNEGLSCQCNSYWDQKSIEKILSKNSNNDTISYEIVKSIDKVNTTESGTTRIVKSDTSLLKIWNTHMYDQLSNIPFENEGGIFTNFQNDSISKSFNCRNYASGNNCLDDFFKSGCTTEGCTTYERCILNTTQNMNSGCGVSYSANLVYYKNNKGEDGNPIIIPLFTNQIINENLELFPNPAENNITIKTNFEGNSNVKIYSLESKLLFETQLNSSSKNINISNLSKGTYLVLITNRTGFYKRVKLVKR